MSHDTLLSPHFLPDAFNSKLPLLLLTSKLPVRYTDNAVIFYVKWL